MIYAKQQEKENIQLKIFLLNEIKEQTQEKDNQTQEIYMKNLQIDKQNEQIKEQNQQIDKQNELIDQKTNKPRSKMYFSKNKTKGSINNSKELRWIILLQEQKQYTQDHIQRNHKNLEQLNFDE
ncbi:hypothetical protein M0813_16212 [Anaeramoeba flamelloides]|uniref:Uncharacterized protein n=1 Tax=Anaeramoeba flamelloides TaxID=1746091 RepID=A0ABQ8YZU5_9EUKA|nr:hypothetical protein M0813_16212 [Anaeramoeba flamelloides]